MDALVAAIGSQAGISRSEASRICQGLDGQIQAFLERPLDRSGYPDLYLDATYLHGRLGKNLQVCSRAVVVAMGVNADGRRELLGLKVGDRESEPDLTEIHAYYRQKDPQGEKAYHPRMIVRCPGAQPALIGGSNQPLQPVPITNADVRHWRRPAGATGGSPAPASGGSSISFRS